jgi:dihydroorotase (multifunctional complex type)
LSFELGIEGGTVVTASGRRRANVYMAGGKIAAIRTEQGPADRRIDASGLLVMPGMVDTHVHLMEPDVEREDYPTGTAAAARAGVTTIIEHTHGAPIRSVAELDEKRERVATRARIDFGLAAHAWPGYESEIGPLWRAGIAFFKIFTCTTHGVPGLDNAKLFEVFTALAMCRGVALVHAEDQRLTSAAEDRLRTAGRLDGGVVPEWRNREAELVAVNTVALVARLTGARAVIAHVSTPHVADLIARERALGAQLAAETCPAYLSVSEAEVLELGAFRKFTPPARARSDEDLAAMWAGLLDGSFQLVSTDHAPSTARQKTQGNIWDAHFGLPGLDTTLSVLLDGAHRGLISYELVTELYSTAPARQYGLWPRKGRLEVGADADVVVVDPNEAWTVRDEDILSTAGWSPLSGRTLHGRAVLTIARGRVAAEAGEVLAEPGDGAFVPGAGVVGS